MSRTVFVAAQVLLGLAMFLGLEGSALAAGNVIAGPGGGSAAWTVYAFGNAQAVADAFRALTNFTASSVFQSLVGMVAVVGVLGVGLSGGFNPAMAKRFISYAVGVFLTCYILFGTTNNGPLVVNVEVVDTVDLTWKAPVTVPAIVGIPAAMISSAGFKVTQAIEASFAIPDAFKMSQGAPFNLATSMLADASQARITDPKLASSLSYYVQDCFTMGVAVGELDASVLLTSTNFINDIKVNNKSMMVNTMLPDGTANVVTCIDAWTLLNAAITAQGGSSADFLNKASAWSKTPAMSVLNAAADSMAQWATNGGVTDGASIVKQAAVLAAFRDAHSQAASQTGNSEFLTAIATTQATESQRTSWITGSEIFNKTMGYIFAIIQVFVYAITPLVLCAALVPGLGLALLKNFSQILLWLAIWQPMLAIVNFIIISMQQSDLGGALATGGGGFGITMTNMGIITERTANLRAAASFVGTMVPALAWAMVKGSVDFSRVIGSAVGENFAQGAANTMTTGNYSLNQSSMDSFTANKHSIASSSANGHGYSTNDGVGSHVEDLGGGSMPRVGGQDVSVTPSSSMGAGDNGQTTKGGNLNRAASTGGSTAVSDSNGTGGAYSESGGTGAVSSGSTSFNGNMSVSATKPLIGGTTGAGSGGGNGNSNPKEGGDGGTPAQTGAPAPKAFRADASGNLALGSGTQQVNSDTFQRTNQSTTNANHNEVATKTTNQSMSAAETEQASKGEQYQRGDNMQISAPASLEARTQAAQAVMAQRTGWLTDGLGYAKPNNSQIGHKVTELGTPGYVEGRVQETKDKVGQDIAKDVAKERSLENADTSKEREIKASSQRELAKIKADAEAAEKPAHVGAVHRAVNALIASPESLKNDYETIKDMAGKAFDKIMPGASEAMKDKAEGAHTPKPEATTTPTPTPAQPAAPDSWVGGMAAGYQKLYGFQLPQSPAPAHADKPQPAAGGTQGKPAAPAHAEQPAQGGQPQQGQPASRAAQPAPTGKPAHAEHSQHAPQGEHGPKKEEHRDRPDQVAMAPQSQQPQQQVPQPQVPQPEPLHAPQPPAPHTEQPQQVALSQQQQDAAHQAPNPFSGEKAQEGGNATQGQVQMAEQRAERLDNQRKEVDGVLASAEGRKAGDLPGIISKARDITRT